MISLTSKVDINLGYGCNARCPFCYYYDSVVSGTNLKTLTTEQARKRLQRARRLGIKEIEFTGGEVTLRKDLPELIMYCKQELAFDLVSIITNGIVFSNMVYAKKLFSAGLDDVLFSLHGHDAITHDDLTATPRSFERMMKAIENANSLGLRVRTNTVICRSNYKYVADIVQLCIASNVDNINLIMFNPIIQVAGLPVTKNLSVSYQDAGREIVRALTQHQHKLPHTNIRYIPFCFVPGFEHFVTNHDQFNYEADEWNNYMRECVTDGVARATKRALFGLRYVRYKAFALRHGIKGLLMAGMSKHYTHRKTVQSARCNECTFVNICDYVWKNYHAVYGDEVSPVKGKRISSPVWQTEAANLRIPGVLPPK
jgi:MoaA/NifB/PqqE/SkfB family radical SAM enzyme